MQDFWSTGYPGILQDWCGSPICTVIGQNLEYSDAATMQRGHKFCMCRSDFQGKSMAISTNMSITANFIIMSLYQVWAILPSSARLWASFKGRHRGPVITSGFDFLVVTERSHSWNGNFSAGGKQKLQVCWNPRWWAGDRWSQSLELLHWLSVLLYQTNGWYKDGLHDGCIKSDEKHLDEPKHSSCTTADKMSFPTETCTPCTLVSCLKCCYHCNLCLPI